MTPRLRLRFPLFALPLLAACGGAAPGATVQPLTTASPSPPTSSTAPVVAAPAFADMRDRFLGELLARQPSYARFLGLHDFDSKLADYSKAGIEAKVAWLAQWDKDLSAVDATKLSPDDALDLAILLKQLRYDEFELVDVSSWTKRPAYYAELFDVSTYVEKDYAPAAERGKRLADHAEAALTQVAHVRENLVLPLSKPIAEVAAKRYQGYAAYLRGDVLERLGDAGDAAAKARLKDLAYRLADAAEKIGTWLKKTVVPQGDDSHVLGPERYRKLLLVQEGLTTPLDDFAKTGEDDLAANKKAYEALAAKGVRESRPKLPEYFATATKVVAEARKFVVDHDLVTLASDDNAIVRETPPYDRWNQASLELSGPFEATRYAFFNITLPDRELSPKDAEGYVMTFGSLRMTAVHEVYPGHFVQLRRAEHAPTRVQKMFASYTFVEGWAHYTEQMMMDGGFGAVDPQNRLGQLAEALLRDCRYVGSYAIHVKHASIEDVEQRFMNDCHIDKVSAHEQAVRGTFDPGYFAYTLGKIQIMQLRAEAQQKLGAAFDLKRFHDALLAHGSPSLALVHDRVLAELSAP